VEETVGGGEDDSTLSGCSKKELLLDASINNSSSSSSSLSTAIQLKHCPVVRVADGRSSSLETFRSIHGFWGENFAKSLDRKRCLCLAFLDFDSEFNFFMGEGETIGTVLEGMKSGDNGVAGSDLTFFLALALVVEVFVFFLDATDDFPFPDEVVVTLSVFILVRFAVDPTAIG